MVLGLPIFTRSAPEMDEDGNIKAEGEVQAKGYVSSDYRVQTQYDVTLYEWDMWVDGSADSMAWDMYLNLGARDEQSAYHEYFMSIQVEEGETFLLDEINISGNFDNSWWNPWGASEVGVSLQGIEISPPFWEPEEEEEDQDWDEEDEDQDWDEEDDMKNCWGAVLDELSESQLNKLVMKKAVELGWE